MRIIVLIFIIFLPLVLSAQESMMMPEVSSISIADSVADRQPVGVDTAFVDVQQLYCFTEVKGAAADGKVTHVWYHGDKEMARTDLNVKADRWRTWSSKRIIKEWTGMWRVDVLSAAGEVLASKSFTVK